MTLTPDQYNQYYKINYHKLEIGMLYQHSEVVFEPNVTPNNFVTYFTVKTGNPKRVFLTKESIVLLCQKTKVSFGMEYKVLFRTELLYRIFYAPFYYDKVKLTTPILKKVY